MGPYRTHAELRRLHAEAEWSLAGVLVEGVWHPISADIDPPPSRQAEARLVSLEPLPTVLAGDDAGAVSRTLSVALERGWPLWSGQWGREIRIGLGMERYPDG